MLSRSLDGLDSQLDPLRLHNVEDTDGGKPAVIRHARRCMRASLASPPEGRDESPYRHFDFCPSPSIDRYEIEYRPTIDEKRHSLLILLL
ncbi:hypothetical protein EVAR_24484_1 [Eumeta japonica]|uniref:Uncharacterized protein n=1 Tax=Eumeta variegata TaxID=151549 RepID=A0A4C1WV35_EUMVA|nr:hypothetical protein EVAR_24484_1 [Eumeta japonica]